MSSAVARTYKSVPERTAPDTWRAIVSLIAPEPGDARDELMRIEGIACSLITDKAFRAPSPATVTGPNPRVRIYCIYDDDAIEGDKASEQALSFTATEGDWAMSLPCFNSDLSWVQAALKNKSTRITARDRDQGLNLGESNDNTRAAVMFDEEAFLRS
ncbi:MAG: hypothetical protein JST30_07640 [Armatimonadetes bacterium]|nr:hypothetical protein [Armatimonadota bacterium]